MHHANVGGSSIHWQLCMTGRSVLQALQCYYETDPSLENLLRDLSVTLYC